MAKKKLLICILVALFLVSVIVSLSTTFADGNPTISFTTSGLSSDASGTILTIDGVPLNFTQLQSLSFNNWTIGSPHTITAASTIAVNSSNRYVFSSWTNGCGLVNANGTFTTPSSDTTVTVNYVPQIENTFSAIVDDPTNAGNIVISGTYIGNLSTVATLNVGNGWSDNEWTDYGKTVTFAARTSGSGATEQWALNGSYTSDPLTTGGNTISPPTDYCHQYSVTFASSPSGSATTLPSGTATWEDAGPLAISATENAGAAFAQWTSNTTSITFDNPSNPETTATISGPGTITAMSNLKASDQLVFSTVDTQTAGTPFQITVTAEDAQGNTVTWYTGTVHFTSTDGQAVLPVDYTFQTGDSGTHVFTVTLETAGSQTITATDSTNLIDGTSNPINVNPAVLYTLVVSPSSASITAGYSKAFTAEGYDQYGNNLGNYTYSVTWSIQSGAHGSWSSNVYTSQTSGSWTVTATTGSVHGTATLTVNAGSLSTLSVSLDPSTVTAGGTSTGTAIGYDNQGNSLGTESASWSITASAGGSWSSNVYTSQYAGTWTVTATVSGIQGTATLIVTAGSFNHIACSVSPTSITAGSTSTGTATAYDSQGNSIGIITASWSIQAGAGGSWSSNVYTSQFAGTWTVTATYSGKQATCSLTVNPGSLDHITCSMSPTSVTAGQTSTGTATGWDNQGNSLGTESASWSIQSGASGSWSSNVYTSKYAGTWIVTATYSSKHATTTLTVNTGPLNSLTVSLSPTSITAGSTTTGTATGYDNQGNDLGTETATWSIQSGAGGSWTGNVYTSHVSGTWTITATVGTIQGTATLTVNVGILYDLIVTLTPSTVTAGSSTTATDIGYDNQGNSLGSETSSTTWSIQSGAHGSWSSNVYTSTTSGSWIVTATIGSVQGSATLTVNVGNLYRLSITLTPSTVTAGSTTTATDVGYDSQGNSLGSETTSTTWSISSGAGGSWSTNVYTSHASGTWTVTGTVGSVQGTATLTVNKGALYSLIVSMSPSSVTAGSTSTGTATGYDSQGNNLGTETASWSISPGAGGSWASNVYTSEYVGTWTVTAAAVGGIQGTATLTVNAGSLSYITVSPSPATIFAGGNVTFTSTAYDNEGNNLGIETSSTNWSINSSAGGSWVQQTGTYTSEYAGTWTVIASYLGKTATATLTVKAGEVYRITCSVNSTSVTAGSVVTGTATAWDSNNNNLGTISASWSIQDGAGGSWLSNVYTSEYAGTWTVTATYSGMQATTNLTVTPGPAVSLTVSGFLNPATAGASGTITVTALDQYGNIATDYAGMVKITSSDSKAVLPANAGLFDGVGSFSVTLETAGVQSITATDTVTSSISGSQIGITVNPASASLLVVSGFPSSVTGGSAQSVTVTALDAYGNIATDFSGVVTISSSDGKAVLPSPGTLTSGVGSFSVTLETAGSQSITASASGVTSGSQADITVNPAALDHFVVTSPGSATADSPFSVTVTAEDAFGNTVTSFNGTVSLSAGNYSVTPSVSGSFTEGVWTGLVTLNSGTVTITVTDGSGHSGSSGAITVEASNLTPTPTPSPTPTPTALQSSETTPTPAPTASPSPKRQQTLTATPSATASGKPTPTITSRQAWFSPAIAAIAAALIAIGAVVGIIIRRRQGSGIIIVKA